ncbi:hypothetical protein SAMD00019534_111270 [Acytostelium subglobosum LB1]|uniref:hypothetical protein n=1 Tax=Acytostelium subglobosum LB1 TaxID=1410327 RepID=UPI000644FF97|nr:hypothetical protein SAMD00019534_111270 [Acytostelium subglobosum LB1]GAM27951.1 hypothetical protein SAMD00019534_111270 [Acytostelium subglobosum LB1]|eukprot:XP_012749234.1 hypothetical protein SAMD00019534_111270 [Acytostelium subglobosum LB1]
MSAQLNQICNPTSIPNNTYDTYETVKYAVIGLASCIPVYGTPIAAALWFITTAVEGFISKDSDLNNYISMCKLIDNKIADYDYSGLLVELKNCADRLNDYVVAYNNWKATPNVTMQNTLLGALTNARNQFSTSINHARRPGYEFQELMIFSMMATMNLMLIREAITVGPTYGKPAVEIKQDSATLTALIKEYSAYAKLTYNNGIAKLKTQTPNDSNLWNNINTTRNMMIIGVFDYVNVWWTLDLALFPKGGPIQERVRYLYTQLCGHPLKKDWSSVTVQDIDPFFSKFVAGANDNWNYQQYQGELKEFQSNWNQDMRAFIDAQPVFYDYEKGTRAGHRVTAVSGQPLTRQIFNVETDTHSGAQINYARNPQLIVFPIIATGTYGDGSDPKPHPMFTFRKDYLAFNGHKIANLVPVGINILDKDPFPPFSPLQPPHIAAFSMGFLPTDVFHQNVVFVDKTTCIDAQKYIHQTGNVDFMPDYFNIGYHAMRLPPAGSFKFRFDLSNTGVGAKKFQIWMFVSCPNEKSMATPSGTLQFLQGANVVAKFNWTGVPSSQIVNDPACILTLQPNGDSNIFEIKYLFGQNKLYIKSILFVPTA